MLFKHLHCLNYNWLCFFQGPLFEQLHWNSGVGKASKSDLTFRFWPNSSHMLGATGTGFSPLIFSSSPTDQLPEKHVRCLQKGPVLDSHLSTWDTFLAMSTFEANCPGSEKRHSSSREQAVPSVLVDENCMSLHWLEKEHMATPLEGMSLRLSLFMKLMDHKLATA